MHLAEYNYFNNPTNIIFDNFITSKKKKNFQLVLKLRNERLIIIPGSLFEVL
jgi:hypothetical protein